MRILSLLLALAASASTAAIAGTLPSATAGLEAPTQDATLRLPAIDAAKALVEDAAAPKDTPLRYAIALDAQGAGIGGAKAAGQWKTLADGRRLWRIALDAPNALTIDVGFERLWLPQGAELYLASADGKFVRGPWTAADNPADGTFWTPVVPGAGAIIELVVPAATADRVELALATVHAGYRDIFTGTSPYAKAGTCNIDAVCPQGNGIRDPIRAAVRYTAGGSLCSGQLVNNTSGDNRRLLSTANHCLATQGAADSLVAYWRYESPTCRTVGSVDNGSVVPLASAIAQTGGTTLVATHQPSDFTLLELRTAIPAAANPYWNGWDRRENVPTRTSVVHHPQGHEKRISFDNDPAQLSDSAPPGVPGQRHWRVVDWDAGTTEGGSSGSGLLDQNNRVIGVLSGGAAACGNELDDYFGRLSVAWTGGGTAASRLSDHLAPTGASVEFLEGANSCAAPTFTFSTPAEIGAGDNTEHRVTDITGQGPYTVEFDVDGDGITDRRQTGITASALQLAVYPNAGNINAIARVTDATGCTGTRQTAIIVRGPEVTVTPQPAQQVCGDGDADVEPGERWQVPVRIANTGTRTLQQGWAVFARGEVDAGSSDAFGNRVVDNTSGSCPFQFIDIGGQAPLQLSDTDDGRAVAALDLGPGGFRFYGETINQVVMSTNGYLSAGLTDSGQDYDNDCPFSLPDRGSNGARLNVLHDDLIVGAGGGLRRQFFANCPRPADAPGATGCTVFQWTGMGRFGSNPAGSAEFQAILYEGSNQIVYQYRTADPLGGGSAGIGTHDLGANTQLRYACNQAGSAGPARAVCIFAPGQAPLELTSAPLLATTPAVNLGSLPSGADTTTVVPFAVPADAGCGRTVALDYVGTVDNVSHAMAGARNILQARIPASCQVSTTCLGNPPDAPRPQDGQFSSLTRFGNGMTSAVVPRTGEPDQFAGLWFTGTPARTPEWLLMTGRFTDRRLSNQAEVDIERFVQTSTTPFRSTGAKVGRGQITYLGPTRYLLTYTFEGRRGGELLESLYGTRRPQPERTGIWYAPSEDGWGWAIDDHFRPDNGVPEQVIINYFFDATGRPVWTLGLSLDLAAGPMEMVTFQVHCPTCPSLPDFLITRDVVGSVTRTFNGIGQGTYATDITLRPPLSGTWRRQALPALMITAPAPPQNP